MSDLPALDEPCAFIVVAENDQRGPFTLDVLIGEVLAGRLYDSTPIWWPGLPDWTTIAAHAGIVAELQRRHAAFTAQAQQVPPAVAPVTPVPAPLPSTPFAVDQTAAPTYPVAGQDFSTAMFGSPDQAVPVQPVLEPQPLPDHTATVWPVAEPVQPQQVVPAEPQFTEIPTGQDVPAEVAGGLDADVPFVTASPFTPAGTPPMVPEPAAPPVAAPVVPEPAAAPAPAPVAPAPVALDPVAVRNYSSLVDRSRLRAEHRSRIESVDAQF
ncbi:MAG: GYF domain-containing protein, partial [Actinomycetes bacterium]